MREEINVRVLKGELKSTKAMGATKFTSAMMGFVIVTWSKMIFPRHVRRPRRSKAKVRTKCI